MPRAAKRPATVPAAVAAEKKPKLDPMETAVADALGQAEDLPEVCRAMLSAAIPGCLGTPSDERHDVQKQLVSWISDVLDGVQAKLQASLNEANAIEAKAEETKGGLDAKVAEAKSSLEEKQEAVGAAASAQKAAVEATAGAQAALAAAQKAQKDGDKQLNAAGAEKTKLEDALEQHVKPLKEVEGFDAAQSKGHLKVVLPIAKKLGVDDSCIIALPAVAAHAPSTRGAFDCMVLDQLEASLRAQVDKLASELSAGEPAAAERAAAVATATNELEAAQGAEKAAGEALVAAEAAQTEAAKVLAEAEATVASFVDGRKDEVKAREQKDVALQNFVGYSMESFNTLCNQTAAPAGA